MSKVAFSHGVLCDYCYGLFHQVTCNYCRHLVSPPEESYKTRQDLAPWPEYGPANSFPLVRIGCNGHYEIKAVHFNSEEHITSWQPPFSWCPWTLGPRPDHDLKLKGKAVIGWLSDFHIIKIKKFSYYYEDYRKYPVYYEPTTAEKSLCYRKSDLPDRIIFDLGGELLVHSDHYRYIVGISPSDKTWCSTIFKNQIFTGRTYLPDTTPSPYTTLQPHDDHSSRRICTCDGIVEHEPVHLQPGQHLHQEDGKYPRSAWPLEDYYKHHGLKHPRKVTGPYHPPDLESRTTKTHYPTDDDDQEIETRQPLAVSSEQHEPFANKGSGEFRHFTHEDYLKTPRMRCLIEVQHLSIDCPYPDKNSCAGCNYAIKTSYQDRESGAEYLPVELSWPKTCYTTFSHIPRIHPYQVASNPRISKFLENEVVGFLTRCVGIDVEGPTSTPSVKKRRENTSAHWDLRPYVPPLDEDPRILYKGTPIGDLIAAAPDPGSHALYDLYKYARLSNDRMFTKKFMLGEPTRKNLIKFFNLQKPGSGIGEEYCNLLVKHGVLRGVKRFLMRETLLYYPQSRKYA